MSRIIKKISASFLLILMIFSVAFNVLDYGYKVYAESTDDNVEIISNTNNSNSKFKLIISQETYNKYSDTQWKNWLSRYENYYTILSTFTKIYPSQITIDASNNTIEYKNGSEDVSSDEILAVTSGNNIKYRKSEFEKELEDLLNNTNQKIESQILLHELVHVFEHIGSTYYDWVIQPEVMAEVLANYVYNNSNIDILSISILNGDRTTRTSYENYLSTFSNPYYAEYYWLALKIINIQKNYGNLSNTVQTLSSSKYGKNYAYKFNLLIDTWSEISGANIWSNFSSSDISKIEAILDGTIGTLKKENPTIKTITFQQNENTKSGTYITSIGGGAKLNVSMDGIENINSFMEKVASISTELKGFVAQRYGTDGEKIVVTLSRNTNEQLEIGNLSGTIEITYLNENNESKEISNKFSIEITAEENPTIETVTFQQDENAKSGTYITSIGGGAKLNVAIDGIENINSFMGKVASISTELKGFVAQRYGTDGEKIVVTLSRNTNEQLEIGNLSGTIKITYLNENNESKEISNKFSIKIMAEDNDIFIQDIEFKQEDNQETNIYNEKIENKNVKLTVILENINEIDEEILKNLDIKVSCEGFKKVSIAYKGTTDSSAKYEIALEYTGLLLNDLIDEKYVECTIKVAIEDEILEDTIQIEIQNLEEETEEYTYYYGLISEEDGKIHYTEFKLKDEITIEGENEAVVYIKIIGEDISDKFLVIENTTYNHQGKYVNGGTRYGITFSKSGTYKAILDEEEIATITVNISSNPEIKYLYVFNNNRLGIDTVKDTEANKAATDRPYANKEDIGANEVNWIIEDLNEKDSNDDFIKYYCYDANKGLKFGQEYDKENDKYINPHYYQFKSTEEIKLDENDYLILAFLQKVSDKEAKEIMGGTLPNKWRANAIQHYIWNEITNTGKNIGYGTLETFMQTIIPDVNGKNDYIDFNNKTITLDKKEYTIKNYTALKYIVNAIYLTDGSLYLEYEEGEEDKYRQPLITFDVEIEEEKGPYIEILKVDEDGNPLEAFFSVYKKENGEWKPYVLDEEGNNEFKTDSTKGEYDLPTEIPTESQKENQYLIIETQAPNKFKPTKQYVIVTVDTEGNHTYKTYEATQEQLKEGGYVDFEKISKIEATPIENSNENDWYEDEEYKAEMSLRLIVVNRNKPTLKIKKIDQDGNPIIGKGGTFGIKINGKELNPYARDLNENGEIEIRFKEESLTGNEYEIEIKEITPPAGYQKPAQDTYTFKVAYTEENGWEIVQLEEDDTFKVSLDDTLIQVQIENIKKKDLTFQMKKVDATTGSGLAGAKFEVTGGLVNKTYTSSAGGFTEKIKISKDELTPGEYTIRITETQSPGKEYKKIEGEVVFKIVISEEGKITVGRASNSLVEVTTNSTDTTTQIIVTVKNYKEDEDTPVEDGVQFPLIMKVSGKVWLDQPSGKNSEVNGEYDSNDKLLKDITVRIYEADGQTPAKFADKKALTDVLNNDITKKYLSSTIKQELQAAVSSISSSNETKTNEKGEFSFIGLDPDKLYTVKFEYNGMRYSEIMASIGVEGCGVPNTTTTTAKAIENKYQREELIKKYQEINPNSKVFTQTEVEKYLNNDLASLGYKINTTDMKKFIEDTTIEAEISGIGGILGKCEAEIKSYNNSLSPRPTGYVFPVVKQETTKTIINYKKSETILNIPVAYANGSTQYKTEAKYVVDTDKVKQWIDNTKKQIDSNTKYVGYKIDATENHMRIATTYRSSHSNHGIQSITASRYTANEMYQSYIKERLENGGVNLSSQSGGRCSVPVSCSHSYSYPTGKVDEEGKPIMATGHAHSSDPCGSAVGTYISYAGALSGSYLECVKYYIDEGYSTGVIEANNKNATTHTRIATFNMNSEPYLDKDLTLGKAGAKDKKGQTLWGWFNMSNVDDNKILDSRLGKEGLGKLYGKLYYSIKSNEPSNQDLCVVYRPTVDLGLYDDVQKAIITINGQTETYVYDKRAANGGTFQFGVNQYDIQNSRNVKGNVEEAYADYYSNLSKGSPYAGESTVTAKPYEDIGIRKEDININTKGNNSNTNTGSATAGYYNNYDVNIEMVYKIKIYNQAAVTARVTNIIDYYMKDFEFVGVYSDKECTKTVGTVSNATGTEEYLAKNINLSNITLKGNSSYEIFVKLKMKDPKTTLGGNVLDDDGGYKTYNYAEINGYGTNIGVIDIDSSPGDLIPEGRFKEGSYDDDESKSPTLIFKNPENASRTISGVMFEDSTGKTDIKSYTNETRKGDGIYSGQDTPVAGAIVSLIEVTQTGGALDSPNDPDKIPGLRAITQTKDDGTFEFNEVLPGNYIVKYEYGDNDETVLIKDLNGGLNSNSYNGESYENTEKDTTISGEYFYINTKENKSYAEDDTARRIEVTNNFSNLTNEKAEILNSWKDSNPNPTLVDKLKNQASMFAKTERMLLDIEYHGHEGYEDKIIETKENGSYTKTYEMPNINFGIVERERAELQITKKVSEISIVDSSGKEITGGKWVDQNEDGVIDTQIDYIKWLQGAFVDMEIDKELLSGATLKVTYAITVTNTSEAGNTISNIEVIDYVSNNLNYDASYGDNAKHNWSTVTTEDVKKFVNNTSLDYNEKDDTSNKIDLSTYQTILMTTFGSLAPNTQETKTLTLEKNLSSEEESDFNYENQVEIVSSYNEKGRGDYSSIYGNLDPTTYTSRQGNLNWDPVTESTNRGFPQELTDTTVQASGAKVEKINAIRLAEKDSGNAEEVIITPPTGAKGIVLQAQHYILAITALITLAGTMILIKKYLKLAKE